MTLRLAGSTSGYTEIDAPAVAGNNTLLLPTGNGTSGQVLSTNGSGALSWIGAGKILQVVQTVKTDTTSYQTTAWADLTGMSVTITPSSTSNKVLIFATLNIGTNGGASYAFLKLVRGSTDVCIGDAAGSRVQVSAAVASPDNLTMALATLSYLDSPATTSATTYKIQWYDQQSTYAQYLNRTYADTNSVNGTRAASTITVMEVAA